MSKVFIGCAMVLAIGCSKVPAERRDGEAAAEPVAADNTKKNERDRQPAAVTADEQPENEADRTTTQQVRQGVVKEDSLSMAAKNVKIVTINGVVTLRGPVKSIEERAAVARIAQAASGVTRVDNQLEIAN